MALFFGCTYTVVAKETVKEIPSKGLLEFLAEMENIDGEYVAPVDMLNVTNEKLELSKDVKLHIDRQKVETHKFAQQNQPDTKKALVNEVKKDKVNEVEK